MAPQPPPKPSAIRASSSSTRSGGASAGDAITAGSGTAAASPTTTASQSRQVELILEQVDALPTLSPIATRLLSISSDEEVDLNEIIRLIETDPAMSSKMLALCRRADKGITEKITTVKRAVILLGLDAVRSAALGVGAYELFSVNDEKDRRETDERAEGRSGTKGELKFDRTGFWKYSIAVACCSELLAQTHPNLRVQPEEAFVAGLLHGLGKMVLELILPKAYGRVLALADQRQTDSDAAERGVLGLDHHTAGKRIAERWQLPPVLRDVIWLHSNPPHALPANGPGAESRTLILLTNCARSITRNLYLGWSGDFGPAPSLDKAAAALEIKPPDLEAIAVKIQESMSERMSILGLDEVSPPQLTLESLLRANRQLGKLNEQMSERAKHATRLQAMITAVTRFNLNARPDKPLTEALGDIVRSASEVLGDGKDMTLLNQSDGSATVEILRFSAEGKLTASGELERDEERGVPLCLLADPTQMSAAFMWLMPALQRALLNAPQLGGTIDARSLRCLPLCRAGDDRDGPAVALLHGCDVAERFGSPTALDPLVSAWTLAAMSAAQHERSRRLQQQLAQSTRELSEAQGKLAEHESLTRLGEMTKGAAHEMNNPLTVISGRSQLLKVRLQDGRDRQAAEAIATAAGELTSIITSLNTIANPPAARPAKIVIQDVLDRAKEMVSERLGRLPMINIDPASEQAVATIVSMDRDLIARALSELVINAAQASPETPITLHVRAGCDGDDGATIRVMDRGPGMNAKTLRHAFDAFFSEKPAGRQQGLGLTRAKALIEAHRGRIVLETQAGRGVTAILSAPALELDTSENSDRKPAPPNAPPGKKAA